MTRISKLVLLEFPDEIDAYLRSRPRVPAPRSEHLITLTPKARVYLQQCGLESTTSTSYFTAASHEAALRHSKVISDWLWTQMMRHEHIQLYFSYAQTLMWYMRLAINHYLWLLEILDHAVTMHHPQHLWAGCQKVNVAGHLIWPGERYTGVLAERFARSHSLSFATFGRRAKHPVVTRFLRHTLRRYATPMISPWYARYLRHKGLQRSVLFTSRQYRMKEVASTVARERPAVPVVLMQDWTRLADLPRLFRAHTQDPYSAELAVSLLEPLARRGRQTRDALTHLIADVVQAIGQQPELFSYRGVLFADLVQQKIMRGIRPFLFWMQRRAGGIQVLLDLLQPSLVCSAGSRDDDTVTGELCRKSDIPGILISHGSHVQPKNDLEEIEWGEQGYRLLRAPYPYVALQSPQAEAFWKAFPSSSAGVRTGPLVWGGAIDRQRSALLRKKWFGQEESPVVIVYANTPKGRGTNRFHVYETPDEFIHSVQTLAHAVQQHAQAHLIIKFRSTVDMSLDDLKRLIPESLRIRISVDEPFLDVLGCANLLVSFSSTTIEEALQNQVPVLLFGGGGRYHHVPAYVMTTGRQCPMAPVYAVSADGDLASILHAIITVHAVGPVDASLFSQFRFEKKDTSSLLALAS